MCNDANVDVKAEPKANIRNGTCKNCGKGFDFITKKGRTPEFCGPFCRHQFWNKKRPKVVKDAQHSQP